LGETPSIRFWLSMKKGVYKTPIKRKKGIVEQGDLDDGRRAGRRKTKSQEGSDLQEKIKDGGKKKNSRRNVLKVMAGGDMGKGEKGCKNSLAGKGE